MVYCKDAKMEKLKQFQSGSLLRILVTAFFQLRKYSLGLKEWLKFRGYEYGKLELQGLDFSNI